MKYTIQTDERRIYVDADDTQQAIIRGIAVSVAYGYYPETVRVDAGFAPATVSDKGVLVRTRKVSDDEIDLARAAIKRTIDLSGESFLTDREIQRRLGRTRL